MIKEIFTMDKYIFELADKLKVLKEHKKDLESEVKSITDEIEAIDLELSDAMAEAECERFSRNGNTFYLSSRLFASPASGRKDDMILALKDNGYGDLVTETVNANTLASFVKEQKTLNADEVPAWLADVVNIHEKISVGIRKG